MLYWLHVCICLQLLVWNTGRSHVKKIPSSKKWPPLPLPVLRLCVYYLQHFSDAEDGFVWLSEDHRQFLQTRRGICI